MKLSKDSNTSCAFSLREELRIKTTEEHRRAERSSGMRTLMSSLSEEQYLDIIYALYEWTVCYESCVAEAIEDNAPPDLSERSKVSLLVLDIKSINPSMKLNLKKRTAFQLTNKYEALGSLYVMEGSTLGGQIIVKKLNRTLSPQLKHHYYSGYGDKTGLMWQRFVEYVDSLSFDDKQIESVVSGAKYTFDSIFQCLDNITPL